MRTDTATLANALDVLAREIEFGEYGDGIPNAAIAEAAQRLRELVRDIEASRHMTELWMDRTVERTKALEQAISLGNLALMEFPDGSCAGSRDGGYTAHLHGSGIRELAAYLRGKEESNG